MHDFVFFYFVVFRIVVCKKKVNCGVVKIVMPAGREKLIDEFVRCADEGLLSCSVASYAVINAGICITLLVNFASTDSLFSYLRNTLSIMWCICSRLDVVVAKLDVSVAISLIII